MDINSFELAGFSLSLDENSGVFKCSRTLWQPNAISKFKLLNTDVNQLIDMTRIIRAAEFHWYFSIEMKERLSIV
jgi:hypothetical protein